ncbi:hypothetical protein C0995_003833 [Termitomyces sp. Mi166|nr:hypothetical protein C0995_003833 [Termitomyces sp. Mi166\
MALPPLVNFNQPAGTPHHQHAEDPYPFGSPVILSMNGTPLPGPYMPTSPMSTPDTLTAAQPVAPLEQTPVIVTPDVDVAMNNTVSTSQANEPKQLNQNE